MFNCFAVFFVGRQKALFPTQQEAETYRDQQMERFYWEKADDYRIEGRFIEGVGF